MLVAVVVLHRMCFMVLFLALVAWVAVVQQVICVQVPTGKTGNPIEEQGVAVQ